METTQDKVAASGDRVERAVGDSGDEARHGRGDGAEIESGRQYENPEVTS